MIDTSMLGKLVVGLIDADDGNSGAVAQERSA